MSMTTGMFASKAATMHLPVGKIGKYSRPNCANCLHMQRRRCRWRPHGFRLLAFHSSQWPATAMAVKTQANAAPIIPPAVAAVILPKGKQQRMNIRSKASATTRIAITGHNGMNRNEAINRSSKNRDGAQSAAKLLRLSWFPDPSLRPDPMVTKIITPTHAMAPSRQKIAKFTKAFGMVVSESMLGALPF